MKNILLSALGLFAAVATVSTVVSCKEDKCKATVCAYGGVCQSDGSCVCPTGYEGPRCETITRTKYKGLWTVTEDGTSSAPARYSVSVEDGSAVNEVIIHNFNNRFNLEVTAQLVGDSVYIAPQTFTDGVLTKTVQGVGYVIPESFYGVHGSLVLKYQISGNNGVDDDYGYQSGQASQWVK